MGIELVRVCEKSVVDCYTLSASSRFEVPAVVQVSMSVRWVLTPCGQAGGYRRFGGPYFLHCQSEDGGSSCSESLVPDGDAADKTNLEMSAFAWRCKGKPRNTYGG